MTKTIKKGAVTFKILTEFTKDYGWNSCVTVYENNNRLWTDPCQIGYALTTEADAIESAKKKIDWICEQHYKR